MPRPLVAVTFAIALGACRAGQGQSYLDVVPQAGDLALLVEGGPAEEGLASNEVLARAIDSPPSGGGDDLATGQAKLKPLNDELSAVFGLIESVAAGAGQVEPGDVEVFGPAVLCVVPSGSSCAENGDADLRLAIRRLSSGVGTYLLEARAVGVVDDSAFQPLVAGYLSLDSEPRRGQGRFSLDFDALRSAAPAFSGEGWVAVAFHVQATEKKLTYVLNGFTADPAQSPANSAAYSGYTTVDGATRVRVASVADLYLDQKNELGFWHLAHAPGLGTRAYLTVSNDGAQGDVPLAPGGGTSYWFGRACYAQGAADPTFKEWFLCRSADAPAACIAASSSSTVVTGSGTWKKNCALASEPDVFALPLTAPATDTTDASDEADAPALYLPPVPTTKTDVGVP